MTQIHTIPLAQIDPDVLPRDRTTTNPEADQELMHSIARDGLRQPIEVWALHTPRPPYLYGLISGYRRLAAHKDVGLDAVPAFIRDVDTIPNAMASMVAENEIRAELSPWDRARTINDAVDEGIFDTHDAAIAALHPVMSGAKRRRLRTTAQVVEAFATLFPDPHALSERKLLRLATALRADLDPLIKHAVKHHRPRTTDSVWALITPILAEAEATLANPPKFRRPGRPRRLLNPVKDLHIRRELRPDGWVLIFTGKRATDAMIEEALDQIEHMFGPG